MAREDLPPFSPVRLSVVIRENPAFQLQELFGVDVLGLGVFERRIPYRYTA
jgi:hypothetical protein